ncbi:hypothetical protein Syun_012655 [Stephania yunnanensis]|uniref:Pectinesterase n=1 Tax=Stephania yunnanensis TaxID=152371 RepID=A0AAP0K0X1_9MAGN
MSFGTYLDDKTEIVNAKNWSTERGGSTAFSDCMKLYEDSEYRLRRLVLIGDGEISGDDGLAWLSGALTSHLTCLDGVHQFLPQLTMQTCYHQNLTILLRRALDLYAPGDQGTENDHKAGPLRSSNSSTSEGLLGSWKTSTSRTDFVVAKDGTGTHKTVNEAVAAALAHRKRNQNDRLVIHVKAGVYTEKVEITREMKNLMFVGDGIDRTVITGKRNVIDGATTFNSASFIVSGDGFWARDMTFENTAGPEKQQAVASDLSVFYRCSFKGFQDTLFVHSQRQFYRDCHVYGTIDFIFGNAAVVLQNCDILLRQPMQHQGNMITAQGREDPNERTGISIHMSRVVAAPDSQLKGTTRSYLGRPWKKFSRTVFMKTDLDGLIDPEGWTEWSGSFAISTLFYGEYMNTGVGASTERRVKWPGFHVFRDAREATPFTAATLIQGESWIPMSGVPFFAGV